MDKLSFERMFSHTFSSGGLLELWIDDLLKKKIFLSTQVEDKKEFQFKVESIVEFDQRWRLLEYVSNS